MIAKALAGLALVLAPVSSAAPETAAEQPVIPKVVCRVTGGFSMGSAFRVGNGLLVTAAHVITPGNCSIDGQAVTVIYKSGDFAILQDRRPGKFIPVDCDGYQEGRRYFAIGHARGMDELTVVPMIGTGKSSGGLALLAGIFTAQPGMSGGPIVDAETLKAVGEVNTGAWETGLTGSVELKGTPVCREA